MSRTSSIGAPTADRPGRESAGGDDRPACRAKGQGVGGLCVGARVFCGRHGAADESDWSSQYELTFSLWLERAECEFLTGNFEKAEQLIEELLQRAASKVDQAAVYHLKVQLHVVKVRKPASRRQCAQPCLRLFGIDLPAHPTWEQVQAEYETVWRTLDGRQIESLIDLPLMTDPELQAAMRVLSDLTLAAYFTDFIFVACSCAAW